MAPIMMLPQEERIVRTKAPTRPDAHGNTSRYIPVLLIDGREYGLVQWRGRPSGKQDEWCVVWDPREGDSPALLVDDVEKGGLYSHEGQYLCRFAKILGIEVIKALVGLPTEEIPNNKRASVRRSRQPTKTQRERLIQAYALKTYSASWNAPLQTQQRLHNQFTTRLTALKQAYPHHDFESAEFYDSLSLDARAWWESQLIKGPGKHW